MRILQRMPDDEDGTPVHMIGSADLRELLDISSGKQTDLVQRDIAIRHARDSYDLVQSTRNYVQHLRGVASGRGGEEATLNLTEERARLAREQADGVALKNAKARGELVEAAEVERAWADTLRHVRSRILAVPSRIREKLGHLPAEDIAAIDRELRDTLAELGGEHGD